MFERLLLLWLTLISLVAYFWPVLLGGVADPFVAADPYKAYVFAVTMLAIGSLLPRDQVRQVASRWPMVLGGTAVQYATMPLLAYGFARLAGLEGNWLIGVVMVGAVPGAMASNVLTLVARGNVSYSVSLTTSATLLSPLVVPFLLLSILSQEVDIAFWKVCWPLLWMVVFPVIAGHLLSRYVSVWQRVAKRIAPTVANLTILWIIAGVIGVHRDKLPELTVAVGVALLALNFCGYLAGAAGGRALRLPPTMRRALTLEVGMQNAGLGTVMAGKLFGDDCVAVIPPVIYTFGCMFTGTILARLWAEFGRDES